MPLPWLCEMAEINSQHFTDIEYVLNLGAENSDMLMDIKPGHGEGRRCWVDMDQRVQEHPE